MRRNHALTTIAGLVAAAHMPRRASAATTLHAGLAVTDSATLLPLAQAFGYLEPAGLAAEYEMLSNGAATVAALLGGSIDIGASNSLSLLQARAKGLPIKIVAANAVYRAGSASTALVAGKGATLHAARDLAGRVVAINAIGGSPHIAVQAWIDKNGGDANAVHYLEMPFPAMPAALEAGRVDAAMIAEPALTAALENGRLFGDAYGAIGSYWLTDAIIATESWIDAHADDVRHLAQALRTTAVWANHHHDKTAGFAAGFLKIDVAVVRSMRRAIFAELVTPQLLQPVIDAGLTYGALSQRLNPEDVFSRYSLSG
jgi:NitT/TauT family transport system substrate-binding protein